MFTETAAFSQSHKVFGYAEFTVSIRARSMISPFIPSIASLECGYISQLSHLDTEPLSNEGNRQAISDRLKQGDAFNATLAASTKANKLGPGRGLRGETRR
jgi:hypothetical protein